MFAVGDTVMCVIDDACDGQLEVGAIYVVESVTPSGHGVCVNGCRWELSNNRFKLWEHPMVEITKAQKAGAIDRLKQIHERMLS